MTPAEARALCGLVQAAFPWHKFPDSTADLYVVILGDLDFEDAKRATVGVLAEAREFPPAPGVIRERYFDDAEDLPLAEEGWPLAVSTAIALKYGEPHDAPPTILRAVKAMGILNITESYEEDPFPRAAFTRIYAAIRARYIRDRSLGVETYEPIRPELAPEPVRELVESFVGPSAEDPKPLATSRPELPKETEADWEAKREAARRAAAAIRETAASPDVPQDASGAP